MNLKEFYQIAKNELEPLYGENLLDFRLEQVEHNESPGYWEVVVSFLMENQNKTRSAGPLAPLVNDLKYERVYKSFRINDEKEVTDFLIYSDS